MDSITSNISRLALNSTSDSLAMSSSADSPILTADDIRHGLETLPQELYDTIYTTVFTAPTGSYCPDMRSHSGDDGAEADRAYIVGLAGESYNRNDLKLLHIDKSSRALYAKTYYGEGSVFYFSMTQRQMWDQCNSSIPYLEDWLIMLPPAHRAVLPSIIIAPREWVTRQLAGRVYYPGGSVFTRICMIRYDLLVDIGLELDNVTKVFLWKEGQAYGCKYLTRLLTEDPEGEGWRSIIKNRPGWLLNDLSYITVMTDHLSDDISLSIKELRGQNR